MLGKSHCLVENAASGQCNNGVCSFECSTGYHKDGTKCTINSDTACGGTADVQATLLHAKYGAECVLLVLIQIRKMQ